MDRMVAAASVTLAYALGCLALIRRRRADTTPRPRSGNAVQAHSPANSPPTLVAYASQTGQAEALARLSAERLEQAGLAVDLRRLGSIEAPHLQAADRALFVVSTTGEGDAPDEAFAFVQRTLGRDVALHGVRYGLLALGDRDYQQFCGFGHALDHWLRAQGAAPLFDLVEVDNGDPGALRHWQHHLGVLSGHTDLPDWTPPAYGRWCLAERRTLNAGSPGAPAVLVTLMPEGTLPDWQAGDIAEVRAGPAGSDRPHREYSIASIPADGRIELLLRQMRRADGSLGLASGWLTAEAQVGDTIELRIRRNAAFHAPADGVPMILIGNGTGIAGLRAHLRARAGRAPSRNWLLFGERTRAQDFHFGTELETARAQGTLAHIDLAFSRDAGGAHYVQDLLAPAAERLRAWIADGAAIYVCGSLQGMAPAVDAALIQALGVDTMDSLRLGGRYRRDVY
ncbi:MAG: sulfite reductase subunit alpha [Panacagrimonas sp.]